MAVNFLTVLEGWGLGCGVVRYIMNSQPTSWGSEGGDQEADLDPYLWLVFRIREAKKHVDPVDPDPKH